MTDPTSYAAASGWRANQQLAVVCTHCGWRGMRHKKLDRPCPNCNLSTVQLWGPPPPVPAQAESGETERLHKLGELNRKASDGTWYVAKARREDGLAEIEDGREHGMFPVTGEWPEIEFIVALVNAYRDGLLARASDASHYLQKTMEAEARADRLTLAAETARAALSAAQQFIRNGRELGFIRMPDPDTPDPAHETPGIIAAALATLSAALPREGGDDTQGDAVSRSVRAAAASMDTFVKVAREKSAAPREGGKDITGGVAG